jgi:hypothetical protein
MEKLVYVLSQDEPFDAAATRVALASRVAPKIRRAGGARIGFSLTDADVAAGAGVAIHNQQPPIRGLISFWLESADDRGPAEQALREEVGGLDGYLVAESRPLVHSPPVGQRAPGVNLVTCINRKPGLSDQAFFDLWNIEHRQVALETQSTFAYVRNAVVRKLTPDAPDRDGIVEESFPIEALTNPKVWYDCDSDEELGRRVKRMLDSVNAFLDLGPLESTPMSEYYLG